MMCFMIDAVHFDALWYLANQFNVEGYKGWDLATTESAKRELLKKAIELQRRKGTPWSIKNALKAIGFANVVIQENVGLPNYYNGVYFHNGVISYSGSGGADQWVNFNVTISVANPDILTEDQRQMILLLINEYKPARCVLVSLTFTS